MSAGFSFGLLGPLMAAWDGVPIKVSAPRQRAVLAMLLLETDRPVPVRRLIDEIWGENAPESALNNLQVQVSALRRALRAAASGHPDGDVITAHHGSYLLRVPEAGIDVHEFRRLAKAGHRELERRSFQDASDALQNALCLWRSEPLEEFAGLSFADAARAGLHADHVAAATNRIEADLALGRHLALLGELRDMAARYPADERLRGQLMLALYRSGQQAEALHVYTEGRQVLAHELGVDPSPDLQALHRQVLQHDPSLLPPLPPPRTAEPPPVSASPTDSHLPRFTSSFVGRIDELERAVALMTSEQAPRLVTFVGPGGTGKTRLVVEVAGRVSQLTERPVAFVDLASLDNAPDVMPAVMWALGVGEKPGTSPTSQLIDALRGESLLLVLDNFEQVVAAGDALNEMLAKVHDLTVLVTSRVRLTLTGEHVFQVEPMTLPDDENSHDPSALLNYDAVRLFVERANARRPIDLTPDALDAIRKICVSLDGLPLAVELAAARTAILSPQSMLPRLERSLSLLSSGPQDSPPRQRTLRATLQWSYGLLDRAEARTLAQLSVFAAEWTLQAAEAVCTEHDLLDVVARLLDKSMIAASPNGRMRLLRTVREYASERLAGDQDAYTVQGRFVSWCVRRADELAVYARAGLESTTTSTARVSAFDVEMDNFTAALYAAQTSGDGESLGALTGSLSEYWFGTGQYSQPKRWVQASLGLDMSTPRRAYLLRAAAAASLFDADPAAAARYAREAVELFQQLPDAQWRLFGVRLGLGKALRMLARLEDAEHQFQQARRLARDLDRTGLTPAIAGLYLAEVFDDMERLDDAEVLYREYIERWAAEQRHDPGDAAERAYGLAGLSAVLLTQGRDRDAHVLSTDALDAAHDAGPETRVDVLLVVAACELQRQDAEFAMTLLMEGLMLIHTSGYHLMLGNVLAGLAVATARLGDPRRAALLFGAASSHMERTGVQVIVRLLRDLTDEEFPRVRAAIGEAALRRLCDAGAGLQDPTQVLALLEGHNA